MVLGRGMQEVGRRQRALGEDSEPKVAIHPKPGQRCLLDHAHANWYTNLLREMSNMSYDIEHAQRKLVVTLVPNFVWSLHWVRLVISGLLQYQ